MRQRFVEIYARNEWGNGSGAGSAMTHTAGYVQFLNEFLRSQRIRSVVDLGCGDWQFSRYVDWTGVDYHGFDLVPSVIEQNTATFATPGITFHLYSGNFDDLPPADLLISKDVLQHWSNASITAFLPILRRYPQALITNCVSHEGATENTDIADGDFRCLDIRRAPFHVEAEEVYAFSEHRSFPARLIRRPRWRKAVLRTRSGRPGAPGAGES